VPYVLNIICNFLVPLIGLAAENSLNNSFSSPYTAFLV
jgi:hypothetical protein